MSLQLIYTVGLPGSGKTTWAKSLLKDNPGKYKRVNRDDLRDMLDCKHFSKANEKFVTLIQDNIIYESLKSGASVICDDTNFNEKNIERFKSIVNRVSEEGFKVSLVRRDWFLDVSVEECIKRDLKRLESVGKDVIMKMYNKYISKPIIPLEQDINLQQVYLCDLDGTVAIMNDRSPFDWGKVGGDLPNRPVVDTIIKLSKSNKIIFISGRDGVCMEESKVWISEKLGLPYNQIVLHMRSKGDNRKDSIVKKEIFDKYIRDKYYVVGVFDDRDQVVNMWRREIGLTVFQVNYGDF